MSNENFPRYRCPKCGSEDHIMVQVTTFARLRQYENNYETEGEGDHEWDDDSWAYCGDCVEWAGAISQALVKEESE